MSAEATILIADDHPIVRKGLREVIEAHPQFRVVAEAADGDAALKGIREFKPTVALLDIDMPMKSGLDIARIVHQENINVNIVVLTMHKDEEMFNEAMDLGVMGYVLKENAASDIIASINAAAAGQYYISPQISGFLVNRNLKTKTFEKQHPRLETLTITERKVLKMISENKTTKEIAELLYVSSKTIENHRVHIAAKLNLHGAQSLLRFALENKSYL